MIKIMLSLIPVFFLSAHLIGSADTCGETDAEFAVTTDSDGFNIESYNCLIGSIEDATAEDDISVCGFEEIPTVWFEVSVDDIAQFMYVNVTTEGSWDPVFSIFGGTCPGGLIQLEGDNKPGCSREWSNPVQINQPIDPSDQLTYWIAVGAENYEVGDNPEFDICVMTTVSLIICLGDGSCTPQANFEVVSRSNDVTGTLGLPLDGPFCSGEEVTICADFFYDSSDVGVDWLIGIIPFFGSGWDVDLIDLASQSVFGNGDLGQWVPDSIPIIQETVPSLCTYRDDSGRFQICNALCAPCLACEVGLIEGDPMPGGWFWMTNGGNAGCDNDGTPGEQWGIGSTTATVNFCFDLTVRTFDTEESVINNSDLTFGFQSFSDGVAGCWEDPVGECLKDEPQSVFLEVYSFNSLFDTLVCPLNSEHYLTNILEGQVIINDVNGCDVIGLDGDILNSIRLYFNQDGETQFMRSLVVNGNTYSIKVPDGDFAIEIEINNQIFMGIAPTEFETSFGNENTVVLDLELGYTSELFEYYQDLDGDGFGNPDETIMACELIEGYVDDNTDCDDTNAEINPDAEEVLDNMIDEDCDGVDEFSVEDVDNDGFTNDVDCDDTNPEINPEAEEICDGIDNNCNALVDEGLTFNYYYQDLDSDGYGGELHTYGCSQPDSTVFNNFDCDDTNPNIYPGAEDIPNNGIDEDCDGEDFLSSTHELNGEQIEIYPNPVSDILQVRSTSFAVYTFRLYNTQGILVRKLQDVSRIDCSRLTEGIYLLKVSDHRNHQSLIERIVISH